MATAKRAKKALPLKPNQLSQTFRSVSERELISCLRNAAKNRDTILRIGFRPKQKFWAVQNQMQHSSINMSKDPLNHPRNVISVGSLPELLSLRERILRSVGYAVFTTIDPEEAAEKIEKADCGVLLLCYSLPDDWRKQLVQRFRELCPQGRVVAITNQPVLQPPKEADALVYGVEGPEILIDAIRGKAA